MIVGLFTELLTPGGVQRVGLCTATVLARYARRDGRPCTLLSLNDPDGVHELTQHGETLRIRGFARQKVRFIGALVGMARQVDLAYLAHPNLAALGLMLRSLRWRSRYVVASHGVDVWEPLSQLRQIGLRKADVVTAPSRFTAQKMIAAQGIDPSRVRIVPWGLDAWTFAPNNHPRRRVVLPRGRMLLTVARLATSERYKGIDLVLSAMPQILARVPDAYYVIVGDGDDRPRLEQSARDMGIGERVLFRGVRSDRDLAEYYQACDVFVLPSRKEGFGLVHLEAMSYAKPVIGASDCATPEVVLDGETGYVIEPEDGHRLTQALVELLQAESLRMEMGVAGLKRVESHFTFARFEERFLELLSRVRSDD